RSSLSNSISNARSRIGNAFSRVKSGRKKQLPLRYNLQFFASDSSGLTNKTTRREAFRQAKEAAGIPKSAQYNTHKFVYDGSTENRIVYEFNVDGDKKYIIEHPFDKMGRGNHFHIADATKGSPFDKGRYNQFDGHFPDDFDGFN
ncbi:MAG: hypothetical protein E7270_09940, partial [Lachnospiraceae bacterium]|nr:hypothetical protein [Lachnospiraceae bacterium]